MFIRDFMQRAAWWRTADRIGPDMPWTYWRLFFPSAMRRLCQKKFAYFHPTAEVRPGTYISTCSKIRIGKRIVIRPFCYLAADPREGGHGITIEDDVLIGAGVHMYVNNHFWERADVPIIDQGTKPSEGIVVEKGAWIGANAILLSGVVIGENSVVGAGSIVTNSVPPYTIAMGNPCRVIRTLR